jgi:N-acetylglucosamine-6-sulfatase
MQQLKTILLAALTGFAITSKAQTAEKQSRPNIVFIYTDDQRFDALGVVQQEQGENARFPWFTTP